MKKEEAKSRLKQFIRTPNSEVLGIFVGVSGEGKRVYLYLVVCDGEIVDITKFLADIGWRRISHSNRRVAGLLIGFGDAPDPTYELSMIVFGEPDKLRFRNITGGR